MHADLLIRNAREIVTIAGRSEAPLRGAAMRDLRVVDNGAIAVKNGAIAAVGPRREIETGFGGSPDTVVVDAEGGTVVPGLVDPHTHLLFAGRREDEFLMRVAGASYLEIASKGGGIARTTGQTRNARREELLGIGRRHLDLMLRQGTTTIEIKSGYGLSTASEIAMLEVIQCLAEERPGTIVATFLGAHVTPPEFRDRQKDYVDLLIREMLPEVAGRRLAEYCDVFCDRGAFSVEEARQITGAAAALGLQTKVHADELTHSGGTALAAEIGSASADHVNFASDVDLERLAGTATIAVLLPATPFFLLAPRYADARKAIDSGVAVALGTDFNPTSSISSMLFVMFLACLHMRMDPSEALTAATINAAHAIGRADQVGSLDRGKRADLLVVDVESYRDIPFYVGRDIVRAVIKNGQVVAPVGWRQAGGEAIISP